MKTFLASMSVSLLLTASPLLATQEYVILDYRAWTPGLELPPSAEKFILNVLHAEKLAGFDNLAFRRTHDFDYLGIDATLERSRSFEAKARGEEPSSYRQVLILRKTHKEPDWSKAVLFYMDQPQPLFVFFGLPEDKFVKLLAQWK